MSFLHDSCNNYLSNQVLFTYLLKAYIFFVIILRFLPRNFFYFEAFAEKDYYL